MSSFIKIKHGTKRSIINVNHIIWIDEYDELNGTSGTHTYGIRICTTDKHIESGDCDPFFEILFNTSRKRDKYLRKIIRRLHVKDRSFKHLSIEIERLRQDLCLLRELLYQPNNPGFTMAQRAFEQKLTNF